MQIKRGFTRVKNKYMYIRILCLKEAKQQEEQAKISKDGEH
jgi:hypothetical protein